MTDICKVDGCDRLVQKKGTCGMHYLRMWKTGSYEKTSLSLLAATVSKSCSQCSALKLKFYFSKDKSRPDWVTGVCRECIELKRRERYRLNREVIRKKAREYVAKNKEAVYAANKRSRDRNKEKLAADKKAYYDRIKTDPKWQERQKIAREENKERKRLYDEEYRAKTPEKQKEWSEGWRLENKEKVRAIKHTYKVKRRAQEANGVSSKQLAEWSISKAKICYWCGVKCPDNYHIDHYQPLAKGGLHELDNLVIACATCNMQKNAKDPYEFAQKVAGRLF